MPLPMPKVMVEMIALSLEDIVIFILGLPATSASADHLGHGFGGQVMVGDPGIGIQHLAIGGSY